MSPATIEERFEAADQADRRFRLAELLSDDAAIYAAAAAVTADWTFLRLAALPEDFPEEEGWRYVFAHHYARLEADRALEAYRASEVSATLAHEAALAAAELAIPESFC
jgi:hypothetical protein